jgi:gluconate 2-dehydrogenase gamma chain
MPDSPSVGRRAFVGSLAGGIAAAWLAANPSDVQAAVAYAADTPASAPFEHLTPDQARELDAISAAIIPTDDTPGAREANVVRFIDRSLGTFNKGMRPDLEKALAAVEKAVAAKTPGNRSFANLSRADQDTILNGLFLFDRQTFFTLRGLTMTGMFSWPEYGGNTNKVGWKLIGFQDQFAWTPPFGYYDRE